jgi:hypothetical protein
MGLSHNLARGKQANQKAIILQDSRYFPEHWLQPMDVLKDLIADYQIETVVIERDPPITDPANELTLIGHVRPVEIKTNAPSYPDHRCITATEVQSPGVRLTGCDVGRPGKHVSMIHVKPLVRRWYRRPKHFGKQKLQRTVHLRPKTEEFP